MTRKSASRIILLIVPIGILSIIVAFGSFYTYWNLASPDKTCASCHEIGKSVNMFAQSAHRGLKCKECHGTALSNGFHSLKEKGMMVVNHVKKEGTEDIRLNEEQLLALMDNCTRCHTSEYAGWKAGGHSLRYSHMLLDTKHNKTEQINADCLRCHGMFSALPVVELVEPIDMNGPWKLKNSDLSDRPAIPCMACHQTHNKGVPAVNPEYSEPRKIFYTRKAKPASIGLYYRPDKTHISAEYLPVLNLWEGERQVKVSGDLIMRNCVQCHSPDARHQAGTSDDRTPRGVHEGISCAVCHETHSNDATQSCIKCHPAISNCKLDVTKMNTSFLDPESPNNIHWVKCTDCHKEKGFTRPTTVLQDVSAKNKN
jgi:hypothetical protein